MIRLDPFTRDVIVQLYAKTGRWCRTAELVFLGGPSVMKHTATAPGKFPDDLVRDCERARRDFLDGRFVDRVRLVDVPEEAA